GVLMALYAPIHSGSRAASKFYVIRTDDPNQEAKEQLRLLVDSTATAMVPKLATKSASDLLLKLGREDAEIVAPLLISAANRYSYEHFFSHQPTRDDRYYDGLVEMALHGEVGRLAKLGWGPGWSGNIDPKTGKAANPERHPYQHYASSKTVDTLIEAGRMKRAAHGSGPRSKVRKWRCVECGYEAKDSGQVGRHILTAHKGANPSRTRAALSSRTGPHPTRTLDVALWSVGRPSRSATSPPISSLRWLGRGRSTAVCPT
ncbi:MAG: hypothetical protein Q8R28_01245, partial [Dehalococcoidia bacterium]|nr:hypothetical protein [Dehalococcoidia bacterium]